MRAGSVAPFFMVPTSLRGLWPGTNGERASRHFGDGYPRATAQSPSALRWAIVLCWYAA